MCRNQTSDCSGDAQGSEFGVVGGVFVQTKKVHIREEPSDRGWDVVLVDLVEDESYVIFHLGWCSFSECDELYIYLG